MLHLAKIEKTNAGQVWVEYILWKKGAYLKTVIKQSQSRYSDPLILAPLILVPLANWRFYLFSKLLGPFTTYINLNFGDFDFGDLNFDRYNQKTKGDLILLSLAHNPTNLESSILNFTLLFLIHISFGGYIFFWEK